MFNLTKAQAYISLFLAAAAWGFQPLCIKMLVAQWPPAMLSFIRYTLISLLLLILAWWQQGRKMLPTRHNLPALFCMGLTGMALNNVLQFTGLKTTTVINSTLISALTPAMTVALAALVIREKVTAKGWLGIVISFGGVLLVVSQGSWQVISHIAFARGDVYCWLSQVAWAVYTLLSINVMRELSPVATTGWAGCFGAVLLGLYCFASGQYADIALSGAGWLAFAYTVLMGGVMSMAFWNIGVKKAGPAAAAIFLNVMPLVGMLTGALLLQETMGFVQMLGAVAILGGVYLTTHSH